MSTASAPTPGARPRGRSAASAPPSAVWSVLAVQADDPTPASVQLARRLRMAIADSTLNPGDRLPPVRTVARRLTLSTNTVSRAYAQLAREGVILARAGGGSEVAPRETLDRPALAKQRRERLESLARQVAVRGLALSFSADEIAAAVARELARHGQPVSGTSGPIDTLGDDEGALLSARNRLHGRVKRLRLGEILAEVTLELAEGSELVVAITRASAERLGLREGAAAAAFVKATEPVLSS